MGKPAKKRITEKSHSFCRQLIFSHAQTRLFLYHMIGYSAATDAVSACHNKKRFPLGNLSLFDPNFSAVVIQDKNRVAEEIEVQHRVGAIGQNEVQARRAVAHPRFDITTDRHLLHLQSATDVGLRQFHRLARSIRQQRCVHFVVAAARVQENAHLLAPDTPLEKNPFGKCAVATLARLPTQYLRVLSRRVAPVRRPFGASKQSGCALSRFSPIMKFGA